MTDNGRNGTPQELEQDDFLRFFEGRVNDCLHMSLAEFIEQLDAGQLDPESPRVAELAVLVGAPTR